jgi:hypothetical protein
MKVCLPPKIVVDQWRIHHGINPKSEALNPKQIRNPNAQNVLIFDIWICLEFRN